MAAGEDEFTFDAVVVGTGLSHSILAAALARAGKRVCHVDSNEYYGALWGSLTLKDFLAWTQSARDKDAALKEFDFDITIPPLFSASNIASSCYSPSCKGGKCYSPSCKVASWTISWNNALQNVRRFNIDICPKLCLSKGGLVNLLIASNIARYLDFKAVEETLVYNSRGLQILPCSKQGLLLNTSISLRDKRALSKFLQSVVQYNDKEPALPDMQLSDTDTFEQLLAQSSLSEDLRGYVLYAMAGVPPSAPWREGIRRTQVYLHSLGVHGSTPFIAPIFGSGELPQSFCRLCAVYGGIYMLNTSVKPVVNDGVAAGVETVHGVMRAPLVVAEAPFSCEDVVYRAVVILDGLSERSETVSVVTLPPATLAASPVTAILVGAGVEAAPRGFTVLHLTMAGARSQRSACHAALQAAVRVFAREPGDDNSNTADRRSQAIFEVFFALPVPAAAAPPSTATGLHHLSDFPDASIGFERAVEDARALFAELMPGQEFLPAAPNPEDVVWEDAPPNTELSESDTEGGEYVPPTQATAAAVAEGEGEGEAPASAAVNAPPSTETEQHENVAVDATVAVAEPMSDGATQ